MDPAGSGQARERHTRLRRPARDGRPQEPIARDAERSRQGPRRAGDGPAGSEKGERAWLLRSLTSRMIRAHSFHFSYEDQAAVPSGDRSAPVTLVDFTDYQCPFCSRHARETMPAILDE